MRLRQLLLLVCLAAPLALPAQSTETDLKARLVGKPLYLRGFWREDTLHFDNSGKLLGASKELSFTVCGIDIEKVHLENDKLRLDGKRVGLELLSKGPKRVVLQVGNFGNTRDEEMHISIDLPQGGDYTSALDAIFVDGLTNLTPLLPAYWQPYAQKTFLVTTVPPPAPPSTPPNQPPAKKVGGAVKPPALLKAAEPVFSEAARGLQYQAVIQIGLIAETDGTATHLTLDRPAGLGLDEQALYAVQNYTFKPATENGTPVRVRLGIEVKFKIY